VGVLLLNLQTVLVATLGWARFRENYSPGVIAGAVVIMGAAIWLSLPRKESEPKPVQALAVAVQQDGMLTDDLDDRRSSDQLTASFQQGGPVPVISGSHVLYR